MSLRTVHGFTVPSVHLNGTGATTLREEYAHAYEALNKAIEAFVNTTCNARDFYVQDQCAFDKARHERAEALDQLRKSQHYVGSVLMGICDQM
jgi:hypothetical protein